jgi:hypothetical protein
MLLESPVKRAPSLDPSDNVPARGDGLVRDRSSLEISCPRPDISNALTLAIGEDAWWKKVGLRQLCGRLCLCKFPALPDRDDRAGLSP